MILLLFRIYFLHIDVLLNVIENTSHLLLLLHHHVIRNSIIVLCFIAKEIVL